MARYQVTLAYDGTHFYGFQRQEERARTVQAEVEAALRRIGWQDRTILAAGRTDTGVHASGQVIAFDFDWRHSPEALGRAMNSNLPSDVAVRAIAVAREDFHPRYDATARTYRYQIFCEAERDPLRERYSWRVWPAVDCDLLQSAARLLTGTHDFAAFGSPPREQGSTIRTVYRAGWRMLAGGLQLEITANAFLYHMVRRLVFWSVLAGQRVLSLQAFEQAVEAAQPQTPGLAPPQGLNLYQVCYSLDGLKSEVTKSDEI
ncbi:MAG: tRNA pseudouridine(38-40) synthase TruA [Chloroflexi bacterium]|nr:tRNA pseudouridine(38-40) synthase TruA [Chloroflexota bacterium]